MIAGRSATRWGGSRPRCYRKSTPKRRAGKTVRLPRTLTLERGRLRRRREHVAVVLIAAVGAVVVVVAIVVVALPFWLYVVVCLRRWR